MGQIDIEVFCYRVQTVIVQFGIYSSGYGDGVEKIETDAVQTVDIAYRIEYAYIE